MRDRDRYLKIIGERFYYVRRVPISMSTLDRRGTVKLSLKTKIPSEARKKRDQLEEADDLYWSSLVLDNSASAHERYKSALDRAGFNGFTYRPAEELAATAPTPELVDRIETIGNIKDTPTVEAVLGGVPRPKTSIREALNIYVNEIAASENANKSKYQFYSWRKVKLRAVNNFIKVVGDIPLEDITREQARNFYKWWLDRIVPPEGSNKKPLSASAGNRDVGNMRKLFKEYFDHIGEENRPNPFRNLTFSKNQKAERIPFSVDWLTGKILALDALDQLNIQARLIVYILIESGARPSEICNLTPSQIKLDDPVPHIAIRSVTGREIKTLSSKREIPLVGVSLEAMKRAPQGFPRYIDKETNLSAALNKAFKAASLFPTADHYIYSFRHSFEKRMTEAGIDYGLRCLLMGHTTNRPAYGDGGSLEYRRNELKKIELPYSSKLFD